MYALNFVGVLSAETEAWSRAVALAVGERFKEILMRPDLLEVRGVAESLPSVETLEPCVVVLLCDGETRENPEVLRELETVLARAIPVLPLYRTGAEAGEVMPAIAGRLNAVCWDDRPSEAAAAVLDLFGLAEAERKLFLSYRRKDTENLALQLRTSLSQRRYDVFLDRFSVPPGADFQKRLEVELADKAFVLLLESPGAVGSQWVQHEVCYALGHSIGVLALTTPDTRPDAQFPVVDEAFRLRLEVSQLTTDGTLHPTALDNVLSRVETVAARQVRRRREQLLGSTRDWLFQAGFRSYPSGAWGVAADREGRPAAFYVTARAPNVLDLLRADKLRKSCGDGSGEAAVVYSTPAIDPDRMELIEWAAEGRAIRTVALECLPAYLELA